MPAIPVDESWAVTAGAEAEWGAARGDAGSGGIGHRAGAAVQCLAAGGVCESGAVESCLSLLGQCGRRPTGDAGAQGDGEPCVTDLWKGFQHLTALTFMYRIMRPSPPKRQNVGKA
jgi:hypothetical protein